MTISWIEYCVLYSDIFSVLCKDILLSSASSSSSVFSAFLGDFWRGLVVLPAGNGDSRFWCRCRVKSSSFLFSEGGDGLRVCDDGLCFGVLAFSFFFSAKKLGLF
jgi:hypothetical protein